MPTDKKLEQYLTQLDKSLGQIAISDKADIITEIRSHVLEALEREPERSINDILSSIGEAEVVANRFLMERGLKPGKAPKTPMIKWLTVGFVCTFGIVVFFTLIVLWKFTPLVKVNEKEGRVQILGGLIDVKSDEELDTFHSISGTRKIDLNKENKIKINFSNGKFSFKRSKNNQLLWECNSTNNDQFPTLNNKTLDFNFSNAKCVMEIPIGMAMDIEGGNAKIEIKDPAGPIHVKVANGKIGIEEDKNKKYRYELKVENGLIDQFESSLAKDAILIHVEMGNGKIAKAD